MVIIGGSFKLEGTTEHAYCLYGVSTIIKAFHGKVNLKTHTKYLLIHVLDYRSLNSTGWFHSNDRLENSFWKWLSIEICKNTTCSRSSKIYPLSIEVLAIIKAIVIKIYKISDNSFARSMKVQTDVSFIQQSSYCLPQQLMIKKIP